MKRYFVYLMLLTMLVNVIMFVPQILIVQRFHGSVMAIVLAVPISMLLLYVFLKSMARFPGAGLKEVLELILPRWGGRIILAYLGSLFFIAGMITLLSIADISIRYISPESPLTLGIFMFLIAVGMAARHHSKHLLYLLEMVLLLTSPLILFIILKAFLNRSFSWDAVRIVGMSYAHLPTWSSLSAATYIFSGYANLVVFNKCFNAAISPKWVWLFGPLGLGILLSTFTIPIAFQGADGVGDYIHPWLITTDSMRIELGFVERVLPLFLLLYTSVSLVSIMVHWHVASELLHAAILTENKGKPWVSWIFYGGFAVLTLISAFFFNESRLFTLMNRWINLRLASEVMLAGLVLYAAIRRRSI